MSSESGVASTGAATAAVSTATAVSTGAAATSVLVDFFVRFAFGAEVGATTVAVVAGAVVFVCFVRGIL